MPDEENPVKNETLCAKGECRTKAGEVGVLQVFVVVVVVMMMLMVMGMLVVVEVCGSWW
jgi:hypothetical protein